jgi:uncharacterized protein (TIGR02246 family)
MGLWLAIGMAPWLGACTIEEAIPPGAPPDPEPDFETLAQTILDEQAVAWNGGDLDGFMASYERAPTTTYIGSTGLIEGFDGIRQRYAPSFAPGAERDSLRFESFRARQLDPRFGIVTARYVLYRGDEVTSTGPFTLVMVRAEGAWRIVHDQSAADPAPPE